MEEIIGISSSHLIINTNGATVGIMSKNSKKRNKKHKKQQKKGNYPDGEAFVS
jgi:hypothetical protein